jgi:Muconolactone delta-isomerase
MLFLIELDHVKQGTPPTPEAGRAFIEQTIFPTLARAEELVKAKKILAGGPVLGRVALRLIVEADSLSDVDKIITSLPIWPLAETSVTPLITFSERRQHAEALLESLQKRS